MSYSVNTESFYRTGTEVFPVSETPYLSGLNDKPESTVRLIVFPYAGGDISAFYAWKDSLPLDIELVRVQLPGRGIRQNEAFPSNMGELVEHLVADLSQAADKPSIFFGYSMGALIAHAVIRRMMKRGLALPSLFCAAACNPPDRQVNRWNTLSDDALIEVLIGSEPSWLRASIYSRIVKNLSLIREDLNFCQRYVEEHSFSLDEKVSCPMTTFAGQQDTIASEKMVSFWKNYTSSSCVSHRISGGHFFILNNDQSSILKLLLREFSIFRKRMSIKAA